MSIRILHTADIHIGLKFSGRDYPSDLKAKLVAEPFNTLQRMVDIANLRKCDIMVIAGDMFDRTSISKTEIRRSAEILSNFLGSSVVVLPGNHDFFEESAESLWKIFSEHLSEHLLILLDKTTPREVEINELPVVFYPGPCRTKHSSENMISWIREVKKNKSALHIGVAHGSVEGLSPDMEKNYFPMTHLQMRESGVDFWLLGHTHIRYPEKNGTINPLFFMPSTPCPDGFDCLHDGYAWIIEVNADKSLSYESVKTGYYLFKSWERDVHSVIDIEKIRQDIERLSKETTLMKLKLTGRLNQTELNYLIKFREEISAMLAYTEVDTSEVTLNIDLDYIEKTFTKDSLPYRLLTRLAREDNQMALQLAFELIGDSKL